MTKLLSATPNLRVVFKDFPILGPDSVIAAKAALAAERQGAYFKFHQAMMANAEHITTGVIERLASKLGLDVARLKADMELPEIHAMLDKNMKLAETIGVSSTPTFVIGSELVTGGMTEDAFRTLLLKASPKSVMRSLSPHCFKWYRQTKSTFYLRSRRLGRRKNDAVNP
jgi:protein-disulfide isomerase